MMVVVGLWHGSRGVMVVLGVVVRLRVVVSLGVVVALPVAMWVLVRVVGLAVSVVRVRGWSWCTFVALIDRVGVGLWFVVHWSRCAGVPVKRLIVQKAFEIFNAQFSGDSGEGGLRAVRSSTTVSFLAPCLVGRGLLFAICKAKSMRDLVSCEQR